MIAIPLDLPQCRDEVQRLTVRVTADDGSTKSFTVICRIDTPVEVDYYAHGGILPFVLRQLVK